MKEGIFQSFECESRLKHFTCLDMLRWHTTYDVFPGGAPVPVALQPPNAVPHLVESHHQRGSSEDQEKEDEDIKSRYKSSKSRFKSICHLFM